MVWGWDSGWNNHVQFFSFMTRVAVNLICTGIKWKFTSSRSSTSRTSSRWCLSKPKKALQMVTVQIEFYKIKNNEFYMHMRTFFTAIFYIWNTDLFYVILCEWIIYDIACCLFIKVKLSCWCYNYICYRLNLLYVGIKYNWPAKWQKYLSIYFETMIMKIILKLISLITNSLRLNGLQQW